VIPEGLVICQELFALIDQGIVDGYDAFSYDCRVAICSLSGCVTLSGTYVVSATDAEGRDLSSNLRMPADGSRIYTRRKALCAGHPGAVVPKSPQDLPLRSKDWSSYGVRMRKSVVIAIRSRAETTNLAWAGR